MSRPASNGADRIAALASARRQWHTMPQPFYSDADIFQRDMERLFHRMWLYAGHVSQVRRTGDFFLSRIGTEEILVIRGADGVIRAFFNVCRHRGSRVCLESSGHAERLVCPYHAWVYHTDGTLAAARSMPDDFDRKTHGLHPCAVRVLEGLIFISLASEPPDFGVVERDLRPYLKPYGLDRARICHTETTRVPANWKLLMENYFECYHCVPAHPQFASVMSHLKACETPSGRETQKTFDEEWCALVTKLGQETKKIPLTPDTYHYAGREPIRPGWVTQTQDGKPAAPLMGEFKQYDGGVTGVTIFCFSLVGCNDYVALIRFTPVSPTETDSEVTWLVHEDAKAGRDYDVNRVAWLWKTTFEQDYRICSDNQAGVNSSRYLPGPYAKREEMIESFIQWYLKQLA